MIRINSIHLQGSDSEQYPSRPPLSEKIDTTYHLPRSPLAYNSSSYTSSHALPPLKFHAGLLKPLSTVTLSVESNADDSDYYNDDHDDEDESVGSAPHGTCGNNSDDDAVDGPVIRGFEEEDMFKKLNDTKYRSTINRGLLKEDLRVEVPGSLRRFTGGEWGSRGYGQSSAVSGGSCRLKDRKEPNSAYVSYTLIFSVETI